MFIKNKRLRTKNVTRHNKQNKVHEHLHCLIPISYDTML